MSKGNHYRKLFYIDRFARYWYCQHARLNQLRREKRAAKRLARQTGKRELQEKKRDSW